MKFEDGPLKSYLIKSLQPLTAADPSILANYVVALLKNNKPKKELQKSCNEKLFDFLGEETKQFVLKLFHDLEDGSLTEAPEGSVLPSSEPTEQKSSPTAQNKVSASGNDAEESSDDEDDDRNHKHRRRVSRSRSSDKDDDRSHHHRKRSRSTENGQYSRDSHRYYEHRRSSSYRGRDREHSLASRIVVDGVVHGGARGGLSYRGDRYFGLQRGGGGRGGAWLPPDQRFGAAFPDGEFPAAAALLPLPGSAPGLFPGRVPGGRGGHQPQWGNVGLLTNGAALEHVLPLTAGRGGNPVNPISIISRQRCLDFEERGFCLRGDLCPMEHGANRIVVEDVQSLSKLTLPRNGGADPSTSAEMAARGGSRTNRDSVGGEEANPGSTVSDTYDPDQPLWGKEQSDKVRQYHSDQQRHEWDLTVDEGMLKTADGKPLDPNVSVWDRIGPVEYRRLEGGSRSNGDRLGVKRSRNEEQGGSDDVPSGNGHPVNGTSNSEKRKGDAGGRDKGERAQRTLYVRCIPAESNKAEALRGHFEKFGEVVDIRRPSHYNDRAFVQFARAEGAEAALSSPEAVLGNRFIRVSWANRDNRVEGRPVQSENGNTALKKPVPANGVLVKKQEELEQMKEEIRKKQEALAAKRDEFKRKLDKLAKQSTANTNTKDLKTPPSAAPSTPVAAAKALKPAAPVARAAPQYNNSPTWGRYKLDNRTAVFRILTPPPTALSDLAALKEHFATFGDVSELSVVSLDQSSSEAGVDEAIQVSFATRRDAEKAFSQGNSWQGQSLQLSWLGSSLTPAPPSSNPVDQPSPPVAATAAASISAAPGDDQQS